MAQLRTGHIVTIRNRLWRIDSIYKNELSATSIDSVTNFQKRFYIPLENIQPASMDIPQFDKIGELSKQRLLINAYRISLIHGTSLLMSLQLSRVIPANFQLVPVVMALNSSRIRLLIADDVGLGKTIEAGLIINELIARHMAQKILIITPANLREQWQETLLNFFNIEFRIISSLHRRYLEKELPIGLSPWDYFQKLITSVDYAKRRANKNEILNYEWDLVIVDEAHLCARPHTEASSRAITMQRWGLLHEIAQKAKHLILVTATPHNGYTDSFASLLDVLDVNATNRDNLTFIDKSKARNHVCQRRRADVKQWLKDQGGDFNPFPERDAKEVRITNLSKPEVDIYKNIRDYGRELMELMAASSAQYVAQFTILHLIKRALSSPKALRVSLQNRMDRLRERINSKVTDEEINRDDALSIIAESDNLENITTEEAQRRIEKTTFGESVTQYEIKILNDILEKAKKIKPKGDSKYTELVQRTIPELSGYSKKLMIFTRYKDTLDYLQKNLAKDFSDRQILSIYGDLKSEQRKEIFKKFQTAKQAILVATDCISEGMNLQYLCSQVVHYELPWNPNRLEQRNGRVDRFGQPEGTVHIRTMIVEGTLDDDILERIIERADRIRAEFGFSPPFFNDETDIINRLIKAGKTPRTRRPKKRDDPSQLTFHDLLEQKISATDSDKEANADMDEQRMMKQSEQIRNDSFYGHTDIRLPDIERKLRQTEDTIGSKEEVEGFIVSSLKLFQCDVRQTGEYTYTIVLNDKRLILRDVGERIESCTFDKNYAARNPGTELIDLSHALVTRLVQILKQQMYLDENQYGRTAHKISAAIEKPIAMLKVLVRYVVETEKPSVVEEILTIGFHIYDEKILPSEEVKKFDSSNPLPGKRSPSEIREDLQEVFANKYWEKELFDRIGKNKQSMVEERKHLVGTLDYEELPSWLEGVTNISYASHDIITVTIGYPA